MGGGKGGSGTSTQYSGVQIPQEVLQRYNRATDRAEQTSQQPWANYGGEFVAPVNATQQAGYNTMMGGQGYTDWGFNAPNASIGQGVAQAQPLLNQASGSINTGQAQGQALTAAGLGQAAQAWGQAQPYNQAATGAAGAGMGQLNAQNMGIEGFLNPYQQQVTEATMKQLNQQQAQQRNDQRGQMIREGSWGGDRGGIANANMVNQQNMATGSVLSGLNQQNYNQALQAGMTTAQGNRGASQWGSGQLANIGNQQYQQGMGQAGFTGQMGQQAFGQGMGAAQAQQGLGQANYGMYGDVAAKQAALGAQAYGQNMQTAQGQIGFGSLQQQTQQAQDSAQYNQWMQERGYPFQTSQFYTNAVMGTGPLSGSSAYGGSFQPQPFFSDERLKENMEPIGTTHDGQVIYRYNFKGQPGATQLGLSAQEVERRHPEAVTEHDGAKAVAYGPATDDAAGRPHKAAGGPLGEDVFGYQPPNTLPPGMGVLGTPPTLPSGSPTQVTGGSIGDIVATQRAMLGANAPGGRPPGSGPPSDAGITTPGAPPSGPGPPAGPMAEGPAAGVAADGTGLAPAVRAIVPSFDGGSANGATGAAGAGSSEGGTAGSVGASVGGNTGTDAGPGATGGGDSGDDSGTWASGGRVGYAKSGAVPSYQGGFGGADAGDYWANLAAAQAKAYGTLLPSATNPAGVGNASILGNIEPAKASAVLKPPESKAPAPAKPTVGGLSDVTGTVKDAEKAYETGKSALFGTKAKGKPGDKDYEEETGGLFGRGGSRSRRGWIDNLFGSGTDTTDSGAWDERAPNPADVSDTSLASGGRVGLGRIGFKEGGDTEDIDAPFGDTSVLPSIEPAEASKPLEPPDPKGEGGGGGGKKDDGGKNAIKAGVGLAATAAGAAFGMPWLGPVVGAASGLMASGGRADPESGTPTPKVRDNLPPPREMPYPEGAGFEIEPELYTTQPWGAHPGTLPGARSWEDIDRQVAGYADGGEVNDNEPPAPGLASASSAMEDNDNVHWGVFSRSQGHKMVGRATSKNRARTIRDKRDNDYGGYDHFVKPIPPTRKRYAGGRAGFADAGEVALADDEAERRLAEESIRRRDEGLAAARTETTESGAPIDRSIPAPAFMERPTPAPAPAPTALAGATTEPPALNPNAQVIASAMERQREAGVAGANKPGVMVADMSGQGDPGGGTGDSSAPGGGTGSAGVGPASTAAPSKPPPPAAPAGRGGNNIGFVKNADGSFAAPPDFNSGVALTLSTAQSYPDRFNEKKPMTIAQIGARWAPISDPKDTGGLNKNWPVNVSREYARMGFDPNKPVDFNDPKQATAFARAVHIAEHGEQYARPLDDYLPGFALRNDPSVRKGFGSATTRPTTTPATTSDTTPTGSALGAAKNVLGNSKSMYGENKDWWDRNEQWSLPLLHGIGKMLSSQSRTLAGSIGEGLAGGTEQYMTRGQRQQQVDIQKQQQNVATVGKIQDTMNQISREKAGILLDNPTADVSAYDKAYQQMQAQQLQLLGVTNVGLGLPPQMADWIKTQPQEIQAFTARVHQSDNPFTLYRIAAGTQDPTERQRIMEQAKAAADRAASGPVRGKDGNPVTLSQEMVNQLLQMRTRTAEASAAGTPDVWQQQLGQAQDDYNAWAKSNPNPSTPELQAKDAEFRRRIADLQAKIRAGGGGGQRAMGGRVGRRIGGMLSDTTVDDAVAPAVATDADVGVDNVQFAQAAAPPPPPPSAPAPPPEAPPKRDEHDANFWYQHAQKMDSVGNKAAADDARIRAKAIEKQQLDTAVTTGTDAEGKPTFTYNPQVGEAKAREDELKSRNAVNQKLIDEAYRISLEGKKAEEVYTSGYNQMFDENGKARMPMGPATEGSKKAAALLSQFLPEQLIKDLTGLDPNNAAAVDKAVVTMAQYMAANNIAGRPTEDQVRTYMTQGIPNLGVPAAAAKFMFEHHLLPQARFNKGLYDVIKGKDPVTSNFRELLHDYSMKNNMILPGSMRGTEEKPSGTQPTPLDAKGNVDVSQMKPDEVYIINGRPVRFGRDGKFYAP